MKDTNLKSQVVSLELSKRLKELGVPQESMFYWVEFKTFPVKPWQILSKDELRTINFPELAISAFLVGELISMLQDVAEDDIVVSINDKTPADTLAEMLCTKLQSSKGNVGSGRTL